jgi:hypothetical protein
MTGRNRERLTDERKTSRSRPPDPRRNITGANANRITLATGIHFPAENKKAGERRVAIGYP